jgi:hypothetical protein
MQLLREIKMNVKENLKEEILKSMERMFSGQTNPLLLEAMNLFFPGLSCALILQSIPEQEEDRFWIMIDLKRIAILEIPRESKKVSDVKIEIIDFLTYKQQATSKESRRRINAAAEIMKEKM